MTDHAGRPAIRRLDSRHVAAHARKAIAGRLRHPAAEALRAVERDGATIVLRLNSGGNALEVADYLRQRGYRAEHIGANPDGYGCAVRVALRAGSATEAATAAGEGN